MPFVPPLKDMRFALCEIAGLRIDDYEMVLEQAAKFAAEVYAPLYGIGDKEGCRFLDGNVVLPTGFAAAYQEYCRAEWPTLQHPPRLGGQGLPVSVAACVAEMFNGANMALSMSTMAVGGAVMLIDKFGTQDQKIKYIPALVSGKWTVTLAMTEPQAGSDLGAIRTKAVADGPGGFRIFGQKVLITFGEHEMTENILHLVLARSPNGPEGARGLSLYLLTRNLIRQGGTQEVRNDIACVGIEDKIGIRGSPTASLVFGEKGGAEGELLGEENSGLEQMFMLLNRARLNVGVFGLGSAERARQAALAYATDRVQGRDAKGKRAPIIRHPDVRRMLMHITAITEAARAISYYTASLLDRTSEQPDKESSELHARLELMTPVTKAWCTESAFQAASLGVQVFGGVGYMEECEASQCFRDARVHMIYEGTTAIQSNDLVLRKVPKHNGEAVSALFDEIETDLERCRSAGGRVAKAAAILEEGLEAARNATAHILSIASSNAPSLQRGSVHYLMLFGAIVGGWLLLRSAVAAADHGATWGYSFFVKKAGTALFFMEHILRPAVSLVPTFISGEGDFELEDSADIPLFAAGIATGGIA